MLASSDQGKDKITFTNGMYEGDCVNGTMHGKGKIALTNGDWYQGAFVNGTFANGNGREVGSSPDGLLEYVYEGDFVNGKKHGKGKYTWSNGDMYEGDFVDGDFATGKGIEFVERAWFEEQGPGSVYWSDIANYFEGCRYEGGFVDGKMQGKGKFIFSDGYEDENDFVDGTSWMSFAQKWYEDGAPMRASQRDYLGV